MDLAYERKRIDGVLFEKMVLGGAANLHANLKTVNDLNVFPIPDGDTGENMYLTLQGGMDGLLEAHDLPLGKKAQAMAQGMLLGARGNSGVILSQLFYGLAEGLQGLECATIEEFGNALKTGVKCAYGAVAHPVEGTILTVAREAIENTCNLITTNTEVEEFFSEYLLEMKKSLEKTPDLLAVLKEAGVIDSGGAGLVYITEGFCRALGGETVEAQEAVATKRNAPNLSKFNENSVMEFGYCTEILLQLQRAKTDVDAFSIDGLIDFLESVGDSVVAFKTGTVVKLHVHTMTPYKVLEHCQQYGEYLTVKIENMTLQHNEAKEELAVSQAVKKPKRARRKFATVTVASGEGLKKTFLDMGADYVIYGGQTNNPSSQAFIEAFDEVNADCIFVLPNNGNILLAAKQAGDMYENSQIIVIESKNVGQGYSALSMLDYSSNNANEIAESLRENMLGVTTGMVARSVRDTSLNGVDVFKDGYMGFTDKQMLVCCPTKTQAAQALANALNVGEKDFVIAVYGNGVTQAEKQEFLSFMQSAYAGVETYEIDGEQDVYEYILIVE